MQAGQIVVTGKDEVDIRLTCNPIQVKVSFKDDEIIIPCNPKDYDELDWDIHYINGHFVLRINWNVSGVRTIVWAAQ